MAQRYEQHEDEENRNREWNRDSEQRSRQLNAEHGGYGQQNASHSYGGTAPFGYGSQGGYGNAGGQGYASQGGQGGQGNYGSQQSAFAPQGQQSGSQSAYGQSGSSSQRYGSQNQNYAPSSVQQGGGYGSQGSQGGFGQSGYSQSQGHYGAPGDLHRGGFSAQSHSPNPGSHSYGGQYSGTYGQGTQAFGHGGSGSQANYGAYGAQGYGGEGGSGAQGYGAQGAYGRYGSQGDYGVPGGYGGDRTYRQGAFGSNAPTDEQLRQGMHPAFADQMNHGPAGYGGGYGATHTGQSNWGGPQGAYQGSSRQQRRAPKSYQRSDDRLKEDIYERLIHRWDLDSTEVTVVVASGVVTLEGTVPDRRTRHEIENVADDAHGVQDIQNNLRVQSQSSAWGSERYDSSSQQSGSSSITAAQSGQSSSTGATQGANVSSSSPALSASTVGKKKDE